MVWMAAIAVVFVAEKNCSHGVLFTRVAGVGLAALGVAVAAVASLLSAISG
jgi:predicted metal-binding membrane protein